MPKYKYFQDEKTMVWQRHAFTVTSESEAEADRIIHENELNQECVTNVYDDRIVFENTETLFDTQSRIEPDENGGRHTPGGARRSNGPSARMRTTGFPRDQNIPAQHPLKGKRCRPKSRSKVSPTN